MPDITIHNLTVSEEDQRALNIYAEKRGMTVPQVFGEALTHLVGRCREEMYLVESKMIQTAYRNSNPEEREAVKKALKIKL